MTASEQIDIINSVAIHEPTETTHSPEPGQQEFTEVELKDNARELSSEFSRVLEQFTFDPREEEELMKSDENGEEYSQNFSRNGYLYRIYRWTDRETTTGYEVKVTRDYYSQPVGEVDEPKDELTGKEASTERSYRWYYSGSAEKKLDPEEQFLAVLFGKAAHYNGIEAHTTTSYRVFNPGYSLANRWQTKYEYDSAENNPKAVERIKKELFGALRSVPKPPVIPSAS